jgi:hypothetical protein
MYMHQEVVGCLIKNIMSEELHMSMLPKNLIASISVQVYKQTKLWRPAHPGSYVRSYLDQGRHREVVWENMALEVLFMCDMSLLYRHNGRGAMNLDISWTSVGIYECKLKYKTSASAHNSSHYCRNLNRGGHTNLLHQKVTVNPDLTEAVGHPPW